MKDESRANWPEGMKWQSPNAIILDDETEVVYLPSEDLSGCNSDVGEMINRYRFAQICALPRMVELLKEADEYRMNTEWFAQVRAVLKSIGEVE